ncbi:MAG: hypothetical protein JKY34_14190 [Kordiimonadaceae bacterium]|nr:hypothetical protein [Kordiimonadaceae bacterium]
MAENLSYSLALDLLFNGQDMDYCERPISLAAFGTMAMFDMLPKGASVGVIGPGGGRLLKSLVEDGYKVDAYEGRAECSEHLETLFSDTPTVKIRPMKHLDDPMRRDKMLYEALICLDDLRAFRDNESWTENVQRIVKPGGFFVYSQVSNKIPKKRHSLDRYFDQAGSYNVSEETAKLIRDSYLSLDEWDPGYGDKNKKMAQKTLGMIEEGRSLRRNIRSGVTVSYVVWERKAASP